jgi:hypothetical protein
MKWLGLAGETYRSSSSRKTLQSGVFARKSNLRRRLMKLFRRFWGPKLLCGSLFVLTCVSPAGAQDSTPKILKQVEPEYPRVLKVAAAASTVEVKITFHPHK